MSAKRGASWIANTKALLTFFTILILFPACSDKTGPMQSKMESIGLGMSEEQVEQLLGQPSFIETEKNHVGSIWLAGIGTEWDYYVNEAGTVTTDRRSNRAGSVSFDPTGKVRYVSAGAYSLQPPFQPIDKNLVAFWAKNLTNTYELRAQEGKVTKARASNILVLPLRNYYRYPDYSNEPYRESIDVTIDSGFRVNYEAELSDESDPWKRNWKFYFNAAFDPKGRMVPGLTNF